MISMDKKYQTRNGRAVRLLCIDAGDAAPVVGVLEGGALMRWDIQGNAGPRYLNDPHDLVEVHPVVRRELWINIYNKEGICPYWAYATKTAADAHASPDRIACVRVVIDCKEGDGL